MHAQYMQTRINATVHVPPSLGIELAGSVGRLVPLYCCVKIKAVPTHNVQMDDVPVTPVIISDAQEIQGSSVKKAPAKKSAKKK